MPEGDDTSRPAPSMNPFEVGRLALSRLGIQHTEELERTLANATLISAETLGVVRAGVWCFEGQGLLRAVHVYDRRTRTVSSGDLLLLEQYPVYFNAIRSRRVVAASDAVNDPRTSELRDVYFIPQNITSTMDAPIYVDGEILGIVCHEHAGEIRQWTQGDLDFATSVADIVAALFQQARRLKVEEEFRQVQERLAKAEQMHAMARLAAGVAHDLNNLLTIISLNASALPSSKPARVIEEQCQVGARLARQLLAFAREAPPEVRQMDLGEVVRAMQPLLVSALGPETALDLSLGGGPLPVRADRSELEQVLLNLAVNARDAMPGGGAFSIEASVGEQGVEMRVSDTGVGMNSEVRARAFEPFFTTKRGAGGTGMGLAVVYGVMRRAKGQVEVQSEPGQGTTFVLRWPPADEALAAAQG